MYVNHVFNGFLGACLYMLSLVYFFDHDQMVIHYMHILKMNFKLMIWATVPCIMDDGQ